MEQRIKEIRDVLKSIPGMEGLDLIFGETIAESLIKAGYEQIPDGAVIITKDLNEKWLDFLDLNIKKATYLGINSVISFVEKKTKDVRLIEELNLEFRGEKNGNVKNIENREESD